MNKVKIKQKPGQKPDLPQGGYAFVVGNGTSRKDLDIKQLTDYGILFACNWFYRKEFRPHVLVCSDEPITNTILKVDSWYPRTNWMYTWFPKPGSGAKKAPTPEKFAAGPMSAYIAANTYQSKKVFLIGMDFFGFGSTGKNSNGTLNNMYAGEKHYQKPEEGQDGVAPTYRNWQRRFQWLIKNSPDTQFYHVNPFDGKSPERLIGLNNFHQISFDQLLDHLHNDTELVDIKSVSEQDISLSEEQNPDDVQACIERQLVGQENVIYPDMMHPEVVLQLRLKGAEEVVKNNGKGVPMVDIMGFPIVLPMMGTVDPKLIVADWQREYSTRYTTGGSTPPPRKPMKLKEQLRQTLVTPPSSVVE